MANMGECPYCNDGIVKMVKKNVNNKMSKVYTCSNASWVSEDGEMFELSKNSSCNFRIWGNSLAKWGKKSIGFYEVKKLLKGEDVIVRLFSFNSKKEYYKYITLNKQYGISVLWNCTIDNEQMATIK